MNWRMSSSSLSAMLASRSAICWPIEAKKKGTSDASSLLVLLPSARWNFAVYAATSQPERVGYCEVESIRPKLT